MATTAKQRGKGPALHPTKGENMGAPSQKTLANAASRMRKFYRDRELAQKLEQIRFPEDEL